MPGYNRKGPNGEGPQTGRGLGPCGGEDYSKRGMGRGCRRGQCRDFGRGQRFDLNEGTQKEYLQERLEVEKKLVKDIEKKLEDFN
jgi:hypothetical protein